MPADPFPLVRVSGPPEDRGRDYGRLAAERIHPSAALYRASLERHGLGPQRTAGLLGRLVARIEALDADYVAEMRGIATGSGLDALDIAPINCRSEMLQLAEDGGRLVDPDGCTGVVVLPQANAHGAVIQAQNRDWRADCAETGVVPHVRREDGPDVLTFTEAGALARTGVSSAGIAIIAN